MERGPWKLKAKLGHCQIWEHSRLFISVQAYMVQDYQCSHARINRNKPHLVNSMGGFVDDRNGLSYLLLEPIPARLSHFFTLNESQILTIFEGVLIGLTELEQTYGYIELSENCICFAQNGNVKIWVNPDLSSIHPITLIQQKGFKAIVHNIRKLVSIFEKKCLNSKLLQTFLNKINDHKIFSYLQAAEQLLMLGRAFKIQKKSLLLFQTQPNKHHSIQIVDSKSQQAHQNRTNNLLIQNKIKQKYSISNHRRKMSAHENFFSHKQEIPIEQAENFSKKKHTKCNSDFSGFQKAHTESIKSVNGKGNLICLDIIEQVMEKDNQNRSFTPCASIEQLTRNLKTANNTKQMEEEKAQQKERLKNIKTSFCPEEPCNETEIQGEFRTFGLLEIEIEKTQIVKNDKCQKKQPNYDRPIVAMETQKKSISQVNNRTMRKEEQNNERNILTPAFENRVPLVHASSSSQLLWLNKRKQQKIKVSNSTAQPNVKNCKLDFIEKKYEQYIKSKTGDRIKMDNKFMKKVIQNQNNLSSDLKRTNTDALKGQNTSVGNFSQPYSIYKGFRQL